MEVRHNLNFSQTQPSQVNQLLNKAEATHPLKFHLGNEEQLHCFVLSIDKRISKPRGTKIHKKIRKKKEIETNEKHAIK